MVLCFLRVRVEDKNIDEFWDYLIDNSEKIQSEFGDGTKILYVIKRAGHNLITIFLTTDNPDIIGTIIKKDISKQEGVMGFWLLDMIDMRFFQIPAGISSEWNRYTITFGTAPEKLEEIYDALSRISPSKIFSPVYIGLNFHLFGWDCIMMSILAKDESSLQQFITENIKNLGFIEVKQIAQVEKSHRIISKADWASYAKTYDVPEGCSEMLVLELDDL